MKTFASMTLSIAVTAGLATAAHAQGAAPELPGMGAEYEAPPAPDVAVSYTHLTLPTSDLV